jgi:hypothetical protein
MPKYKMLVFSNPTSSDVDASYNKWYNEQHIPDVCRIDGFTGAQRFRFVDTGQGAAPTQYLAIYEVEADDVNAAIANLTSKAGTDAMVMTPDIDIETTSVQVFEEITEPYSA